MGKRLWRYLFENPLRTLVFALDALALGPLWLWGCQEILKQFNATAGSRGEAAFIALCLGSAVASVLMRRFVAESVLRIVWVAVFYPIVGATAFGFFFGLLQVQETKNIYEPLGFMAVTWIGAFMCGPLPYLAGLIAAIVLWPVARWSLGMPVFTARRSPNTSPAAL